MNKTKDAKGSQPRCWLDPHRKAGEMNRMQNERWKQVDESELADKSLCQPSTAAAGLMAEGTHVIPVPAQFITVDPNSHNCDCEAVKIINIEVR